VTRQGETLAAIVALAAKGKDADQIAAEIRIARDSVGQALKRAGRDDLRQQLFHPGPTHGLAGTYNKYRCRCDACTDANTARIYLLTEKRSVKPMTHGLASTYINYHCRCDQCAKAHQAKVRARVRANPNNPNYRKQWTGVELEYITAKQADGRRYLRTAYECAVVLGRSVGAVDSQRKLCLVDPRKMIPAGLASSHL
jgi:hypothetical protein